MKMVGIFRGWIEVSFKGLIAKFRVEMREIWCVENGKTNLPYIRKIVTCENIGVATPSMLTMPKRNILVFKKHA